MASVLMNFPTKQSLNSKNTAFLQLKMDLSLCKSTIPADSFVQYKLSLIKKPHMLIVKLLVSCNFASHYNQNFASQIFSSKKAF